MKFLNRSPNRTSDGLLRPLFAAKNFAPCLTRAFPLVCARSTDDSVPLPFGREPAGFRHVEDWINFCMEAIDRRQHDRYELEGPVSFSWRGTGGNRFRRRGLLQNISGGGVFVSTDHSPPEGTEIQFRVSFDCLLAGSRLVLSARARVTRVESAGPAERSGFAAAVGSFTLRNDRNKLIERGTVGEATKNRL